MSRFLKGDELKEKIHTNKPLLWSERIDGELYVYFRGKLIYKRWYKKGSNEKHQPSIIINDNGYPNEWIK